MSRKFWLCCSVQIILFVFLWFGKVPVDMVQNLTGIIISGYLIGNITQKTLLKVKEDEPSL
jgi:Na+/citrate or Na+/malate symporter